MKVRFRVVSRSSGDKPANGAAETPTECSDAVQDMTLVMEAAEVAETVERAAGYVEATDAVPDAAPRDRLALALGDVAGHLRAWMG